MNGDAAAVMRLRGGKAEQEDRRYQPVVETALDVQQLAQSSWHPAVADERCGRSEISRHNNGR